MFARNCDDAGDAGGINATETKNKTVIRLVSGDIGIDSSSLHLSIGMAYL